MPLKTFREYMTICKALVIPPTLAGLLAYASVQKSKRAAPRTTPWSSSIGSSDQSHTNNITDVEQCQ